MIQKGIKQKQSLQKKTFSQSILQKSIENVDKLFQPVFYRQGDGWIVYLQSDSIKGTQLSITKDQQFLMNNKFSLIINTCPLQFKVLSIPNVYKVMNFHWQNSRGNMIDSIETKLFKGVFDEMSRGLEEGQGVLIVSDRGHSRAITFVLLYLMWRFDWDLFKALEYINSKRENLEVRATYLKLLVGYEKSIKSESSLITPESRMKESPNRQDLPSQTKQSIPNSKQKWSDSVIKSPEQQLLTNTFRNTCKKHKINELNQEYREMLAKDGKEEKKSVSSMSNNIKMGTSKDWNKKSINSSSGSTKKEVKFVKFSNEIEIIIKESSVAHIFPQYEQLSSEHIIDYERDARTSTQSTKAQHLQSHSSSSTLKATTNNKGTSITNKLQQSKPNNSQASRPSSKKQRSPILNITNPRMINVRKVDKSTNNNHAGNVQNHNQNKHHADNQLIVLSNSEDLYYNEFYSSDNKKEQDRLSQNSNSSSIINRSTDKQKKEQKIFKQSLSNPKKQKEQSPKTKLSQTSTQYRTQELLNYQVRPSSLKKFKASFLDQKHLKASSPKKKERKQDRILTEPKYDYEFENPALDEEGDFKDNPRRRISASQNSNEGFLVSEKMYQHQKSASTTMAMKIMGRFQKKTSASSSSKNQKGCPTPLLNGVTNRQLRSSSHNNFFTRPLSRGASNSLKMSTKKSVTSSIQENGLQRQNKATGAILNVNINVNIGKLQMFGPKNRESRQSITSQSNNGKKEKLSKVHSHLDKSQLLYNRIRSNSSNDNYSKFSVSSLSGGEKSDSRLHAEKSLMTKNLKEKLMEKGQTKLSEHRQSHSGLHDRTEHFAVHEPLYLHEDDNIFGSESFTKKEIMDKISRKLIKNSYNMKIEEHTKKISILENNFLQS